MKNKLLALTILIIGLAFFSCGADNQSTQTTRSENATDGQLDAGQSQSSQPLPQAADEAAGAQKSFTPKITFIELGSVNCIPCKAMQPVMRSIEKKYDEQIRVLFYDVWTPKEQKYAQYYRIRLIPTQIFLDTNGIEIMRHEGFFPEAEVDQFLQAQGLKILQGS